MWTNNEIVEREINIVVGRYISGQYDEVELESFIEFWLKWETLGPIERRNYELEWASQHGSPPNSTPLTQNTGKSFYA